MKCSTLVAVLFVSLQAFGQTGAIPPIIRAQHTMDFVSVQGAGPNTILYNLPMQPGTLVGDSYLDKKWNASTMLLYADDKLLEGYRSRYDLKSHSIEILVDQSTRILGVDRIQSIVWIDSISSKPRYFVNAKDYRKDGVAMLGLIEVVEDGKSPLFRYTSTYIKKASYNVALDVGTKDDRIMKKSTYYYAAGNDLFEFKGKKSIGPAFSDKAATISAYVKSEKLSLSREDDLKKVFRYYNELIN